MISDKRTRTNALDQRLTFEIKSQNLKKLNGESSKRKRNSQKRIEERPNTCNQENQVQILNGTVEVLKQKLIDLKMANVDLRNKIRQKSKEKICVTTSSQVFNSNSSTSRGQNFSDNLIHHFNTINPTYTKNSMFSSPNIATSQKESSRQHQKIREKSNEEVKTAENETFRQYKEMICHLEAKLRESNNLIPMLTERLQDYKGMLEENKDRYEKLKSQYISLKHENKRQKEEVLNQNVKIKTLGDLIKSYQINYSIPEVNEDNARDKEIIEKLHHDNFVLKNDNTTLHQQLNSCQRELADCVAKVSGLEKQVYDLKMVSKEKEDQIQNSKRKIEDYISNEEYNNNEIKQLKAEKAKNAKRLSELKDEIQKLNKDKINNTHAEITKLKDKLIETEDNLNKEIERKTREIVNLYKKEDEQKTEIEGLRNKIKELERDQKMKDDDNENYIKEIEYKLSLKEEEFDSVKEELEKEKAKNKSLEESLENFKREKVYNLAMENEAEEKEEKPKESEEKTGQPQS